MLRSFITALAGFFSGVLFIKAIRDDSVDDLIAFAIIFIFAILVTFVAGRDEATEKKKCEEYKKESERYKKNYVSAIHVICDLVRSSRDEDWPADNEYPDLPEEACSDQPENGGGENE